MIQRTSTFWYTGGNWPSVIIEINYGTRDLVTDTNFFATKQKYLYIYNQIRIASGGYNIQRTYVLLLISGVLL